jgi:hypothetical protein
MKTRTVTQILIYKLVLNPITDRVEYGRISAWSTDKDRLIEWYKSQEVPGYRDDRFLKVFKKGGPLEWYNPIYNFDNIDAFNHGIHEEWINEDIMPKIRLQLLEIT